MFDLSDFIELPKNIFVGILRVVWWLAWDFCIQTIGWSIGWFVLRIITIGRFPQESLGEVDQANTLLALLVELLGLGTLAICIWFLSGSWPAI